MKPITVGVLTDVTGPAASANKRTVEGVQAGVVAAARGGYQVKYVVGDTATSPTGALTAARKLVTRDHVDAIVAVSSLTFAASRYLTQQNVPVVGLSQDGPEWITAKNMFSVVGPLHTEKVATTAGTFFKQHGVTTVGAVGYGISPTSSENAKTTAASAKAAGLKVGYLNAKLPFGTTDMQPVALAMKKAHVDGFSASTDPNTAFTLAAELRQLKVPIKVALLATGYGADITQAGPGAVKAAQNVYFILQSEPVEANTPATRRYQSDARSAGVPDAPTIASYSGYTSMLLLVQALDKTGGDTSATSLIQALSGIHDFNAGGLYGDQKVDINDRENVAAGPNNCIWIVKLSGSAFHVVPDANPICGQIIPGLTVSP